MYVDIKIGMIGLELTGIDLIGYSFERYFYFSNGRSVSFQSQYLAVYQFI